MLWPSIVGRPRPLVALACGSRSTSSTRAPRSARQAARLTEVVVFPTPPFWFATAIIFIGGASLSEERRLNRNDCRPLPAGHDANDFHAVALRQRALGPFIAME